MEVTHKDYQLLTILKIADKKTAKLHFYNVKNGQIVDKFTEGVNAFQLQFQ